MSAKSYKKKHSTKTSIDIFFEKRPYASILLSGLLSAAGLLIIYACIGIFPFGDKSVQALAVVSHRNTCIGFFVKILFSWGAKSENK